VYWIYQSLKMTQNSSYWHVHSRTIFIVAIKPAWTWFQMIVQSRWEWMWYQVLSILVIIKEVQNMSKRYSCNTQSTTSQWVGGCCRNKSNWKHQFWKQSIWSEKRKELTKKQLGMKKCHSLKIYLKWEIEMMDVPSNKVQCLLTLFWYAYIS